MTVNILTLIINLITLTLVIRAFFKVRELDRVNHDISDDVSDLKLKNKINKLKNDGYKFNREIVNNEYEHLTVIHISLKKQEIGMIIYDHSTNPYSARNYRFEISPSLQTVAHEIDLFRKDFSDKNVLKNIVHYEIY